MNLILMAFLYVMKFTCATANQKSCLEVYEWPGSPGSTPFSFSHMSDKEKIFQQNFCVS